MLGSLTPQNMQTCTRYKKKSNLYYSRRSRYLSKPKACYEQGVTAVRFGTELRYGTFRFWQKVRYGITYGIFRKSTVRKYGIIFSVPHSFRTPVTHALHFCIQVLHFSFLPMTLPSQLRSPLTPPVTPHNI